MTRHRPSILFAVVAAFVSTAPAGAQSVPRIVFTRTDGTSTAFALSAIQRLDVDTSQVVVRVAQGGVFTFPRSSLRAASLNGAAPAGVSPAPAGVAEALRLLPGYPNPARRSVTLAFELPRRTHVVVDVFAVTGQRVRTVVAGDLDPGSHVAVWDGADDHGRPVSNGLYFYRLRGATSAQRVTILR